MRGNRVAIHRLVTATSDIWNVVPMPKEKIDEVPIIGPVVARKPQAIGALSFAIELVGIVQGEDGVREDP